MTHQIRSLVRSSIVSLVVLTAAHSMAQINVAASANGGVGSQSSVYHPDNTPNKGNDGNRDGRYENLSLMHTQFETDPWYKIDFSSSALITQVNVFNRSDSWMWRLNPFAVSLSLNGNQVWSATNQTFTQNISDPNPWAQGMSFVTPGVLADSVMVRLDGRTEWLHVAELEAMSAVPEPASLTALAAGAAFLLRRRKSSARS